MSSLWMNEFTHVIDPLRTVGKKNMNSEKGGEEEEEEAEIKSELLEPC